MKNIFLALFWITFIAIVTISCSEQGYKENKVDNQLTIDMSPADGPDGITINNDDGENRMEKFNYMEFIKKFWSENREILEKASCDMKASGIDYVFNGKAFVIKDGIPSRIETDYPDSVDLILEQSEGKIKEFGWSRTPDPMFTEGENYFYFKTPRFYNEYGSEIAISLVYTENPKETIEYENEALSSNWYLVTQYYGE